MKLLKIKQLMFFFCEVEFNQGNLSHMLYSLTSKRVSHDQGNRKLDSAFSCPLLV